MTSMTKYKYCHAISGHISDRVISVALRTRDHLFFFYFFFFCRVSKLVSGISSHECLEIKPCNICSCDNYPFFVLVSVYLKS